MNFVKYHGGKGRMSSKIVPLLPEHKCYVEPFLGGGSVLLNKKRSIIEIAYDTNPNVVAMWESLQDGTLIKDLKNIDYSEKMFEMAKDELFTPGLNEYILLRMSRGALKKDFAWSDRTRGGLPGDVNAWNNAKEKLPEIQERVKWVWFQCADGIEELKYYDAQDTVIYCDPPYVPKTRTSPDIYHDYEMSEEDHVRLLNRINNMKYAKVLVSGYENHIYLENLGEPRYTFNMPNNAGQGKTKNRRVECIWTNYDV